MQALVPAKQVMVDFGGVCEMTLHRWLADDGMGFPRPIYIRNRRYWDAGALEEFKRRAVAGAVRSRRTERASQRIVTDINRI